MGRIISRILSLVILCVLGLVSYLTIVGFPAGLVDRYIREFDQREQIGLAVGRVRFFPPNAIWIKDLRIEGARIDTHPFFKCDDCWVKLDWRAVRSPFDMIAKVHIENGSMTQRLYDAEDAGVAVRSLHLKDIAAQIKKEDKKWIVNSATGRLGAADISARGTYFSAIAAEPPEELGLRRYADTRALMNELRERGMTDALHRWQKDYDGWSFPGNASVDILFEIHGGAIDRSSVDVGARSDRMRLRGLELDDLVLEGTYADRKVKAAKLAFTSDGDSAEADFIYDLDSSELELGVSSNLDSHSLFQLMPEFISKRMRSLQLELRGAVEFECRLGPTTVDRLEQRVVGTFKANEVLFRKIPVASLAVEVERRDDAIAVDAVEIQMQSGSIRGEGRYNSETGAYAGIGRANFNPDILLPFVQSSKLREIIASVELDRDFVKFDGECRGVLGGQENIYIHGLMEGDNFKYNGSSYQNFKSTLTVSNRMVGFRDFELRRSEGVASGRVIIDLEAQTVEFNAVSGCEPKAMIGIINTGLVERLDWLEFNGPVQASATGVYDYGEFVTNNVQASVSARDFAVRGVAFDQADFNLNLAGNVLKVNDIKGRAFDGDFTGSAELLLAMRADGFDCEYDLTTDLKDADLAMLVTELKRSMYGVSSSAEEKKLYEGQLGMSLEIEGAYREGGNAIETGDYKVEIREGRLFRVPLLGGLSHYLSKIIPGFGYLSQTELLSAGMVRPNRVLIQSVELRGGVVTVKGNGDYFFDNTLDIDVQVVPLRGGVIASLFRVVTFPVSKLFEFTLTGTMEDPEWRATNLPKQLFLKFD